MNWYELIIDDVLLKLKGTPSVPKNFALDGIKVEKLQEYNNGYTVLPNDKPCQIHVGIPQHESGTKNESTEQDTYTGRQDTDVYVTVSIASRELYGPLGIYEIGYKATRWLIGLKLQAGPSLSFFKFALIDKVANVWYYQLIMRSKDFVMVGMSDAFAEEGSDVLLETISTDADTCRTEIITNLGGNIIIPDGTEDSILIK